MTNFNPRTHEGCDLMYYLLTQQALKFQSTHPRGVRLSIARVIKFFRFNFNPRTHEGCDKSLIFHSFYMIFYFNPRTHEGCDLELKEESKRDLIFQSTHPRGVRQMAAPDEEEEAIISIHAPTRGATSLGGLVAYGQSYFNPRTHEGCDLQSTASNITSSLFQSTHPRGVRPVLHSWFLTAL